MQDDSEKPIHLKFVVMPDLISFWCKLSDQILPFLSTFLKLSKRGYFERISSTCLLSPAYFTVT
jgi:hypothetical protein